MFLRFLTVLMDRCPSVGSGFSTGEHCHPIRNSLSDFPQVRKLCLDTVPTCLRHCHGCQRKTFCRHPNRTCHNGTDFQFRGDNCWFHDHVVGPQFRLYCVLPPSCFQVRRSHCGLHRSLTSENSAGEFSYTRISASTCLQ
jgi:hypothetical protein